MQTKGYPIELFSKLAEAPKIIYGTFANLLILSELEVGCSLSFCTPHRPERIKIQSTKESELFTVGKAGSFCPHDCP